MFSWKWLNTSIWPINRILTSTTTLGLSGTGGNAKDWIFDIPQSSSTRASDGLVSYLGHSLGWVVLPHCRNAISIFYSPWCNGYRCRIWTRRHKFKSWTWLIAFHIALIPSGKVWIQLFSLQLWLNSRAD